MVYIMSLMQTFLSKVKVSTVSYHNYNSERYAVNRRVLALLKVDYSFRKHSSKSQYDLLSCNAN